MRSDLMLEAARSFTAEQVQKTPQNVLASPAVTGCRCRLQAALCSNKAD